jgi:hypothetical protein
VDCEAKYYTPHSWSQGAKSLFRPERRADFVVGQAIRLSAPALWLRLRCPVGQAILPAAAFLGGWTRWKADLRAA